jgi:hypothetical protein
LPNTNTILANFPNSGNKPGRPAGAGRQAVRLTGDLVEDPDALGGSAEVVVSGDVEERLTRQTGWFFHNLFDFIALAMVSRAVVAGWMIKHLSQPWAEN